MTATCLVCDQRYLEQPARCECGYDFETADPRSALPALRVQARRATRIWLTGLALLASIPIGFAIVLAVAPHLLTIAILAAPLQLATGAVVTATGLIGGDRHHKRLKAANALLQLPAARVIPPT